MTDPTSSADELAAGPRLVAVLDMGASAIRLVIGEIGPKGAVRAIEDASRGVLLGRDAFSTGVIRAETADAALSALDGFRQLIAAYPVQRVRAVATSAVREARNGDVFLDRIRGRTGIPFEIINEAEESRLVYLAVRERLSAHSAFKGASTLVAEVGGGSTDLSLLRRGRPSRSGVYALGAIRLRQQLSLKQHTPDLRVSILKRYIAHVVDEIRVDIPLRRVTHMVAIGGDVRFAAVQILNRDFSPGWLEVPRSDFLEFCDRLERYDEDALVDQFRLSAADAETLVPALMIYRTLVSETHARVVIVADASLRSGALIDLATSAGRLAAEDFDRQVLASADSVGLKYRYDREHGLHVAHLATRLFDQLRDEHGLGRRERLVLEVASLLHDVGTYVSLRAHHKHSHYLLSASQIFGLSDVETQMVANIARYHRRGLPQKSHLPYVALDQPDRLIVNKLAALLRVANGLDAEHLQKVRDVGLTHENKTWIADLDSRGDTTLERLAARARSDLFVETYGRQLIIRERGTSS
jgi:exopolyphosphatase/guanosine-5'-triphosphate,3'-diphosphate pyrophosphatase